MTKYDTLKNLALDSITVTEAAAIAAYKLMGKGNEKAADKLAVDAMRSALNNLNINGTVVIGEGERDKAPMLYIGEEVGTKNGPEVDIALDPLEGTNILSIAAPNALSVMAITNKGGFLHAPDVYMEKIAIGFEYKEQLIDLDNSIAQNLKNIAKAKKCEVSDLVTTILDRPRHKELIAKVREAGSRIKLIKDGDIAAVIETTTEGSDVYIGIGGAPEGVLAAAALTVTGGQMCGRLLFSSDEEKTRAQKMGIKDLSHQYYLNDLAKGDIIFAATGVTSGSMLNGIRIKNNQTITNSILMCKATKTIRKVESVYRTC